MDRDSDWLWMPDRGPQQSFTVLTDDAPKAKMGFDLRPKKVRQTERKVQKWLSE